jgi:hypothetical protein
MISIEAKQKIHHQLLTLSIRWRNKNPDIKNGIKTLEKEKSGRNVKNI